VNKTNRRTLISYGITALLAAGLFVSLAAAQEAQPPARPDRGRVERARPLADLGLTAEQVKALEGFRKARREESRTFRDEMRKLRDETRELAKDPQANEKRIDALIDRRAALMAERQKAGFRARAERDKIFTPEQRENLRALRPRFAGRARLAGRGIMGPGRARLARLRALRHRLHRNWRRW
jgi:Spy/CpxP family protein refolding chaperone